MLEITRKALYKDVSPGLMLKMREENMLSNQEIAAQLGVSYQTVLKYIGKQGFKNTDTKSSVRAATRQPVESDVQVYDQMPTYLRETEKTLAGENVCYKINIAEKTVSAHGDYVELLVDRDKLEMLIKELLEVERMLR